MRRSLLFLRTTLLLIFMLSPAATGTKLALAEVLFSDNFEQAALWDGCPDDSIEGHLPDWDRYFATWTCGIFSIVEENGSNVIKYDWPQSMSSIGIGTPRDATAGLGEVYVGFKWRHDAGWDWGSDPTHKWVYFPESGGDRTMLSIVNGGIAWFDGYDYNMAATNDPATGSSDWLNDTRWHNVVIFASPATNTIRVWYDGTELTWAEDNTGGANFADSTFDSGAGNSFAFGYQSRPDWGAGNTSYFDDIILATTKAEIDAYLGESPGDPLSYVYYLDADGDGYSDGSNLQATSEPGPMWHTAGELTATTGDCDDNDAGINPGSTEICGDAVDNNCDNAIDERCGSDVGGGNETQAEPSDDGAGSGGGCFLSVLQ